MYKLRDKIKAARNKLIARADHNAMHLAGMGRVLVCPDDIRPCAERNGA